MQDDRYPFAPPPLPGDNAKPRRRRRSRGHGGSRPNQPQAQNRPAPQPADRTAKPADRPAEPVPQREGGSAAGLSKRRHRRRGGNAPAAPAQPQTGAPRTSQPAARSPQALPGTPAPAPRAASAPRAPQPRRTPAPQREEDPGLLLIARRAPKQKFANFEEYIAAHGGVTAPLPGEGPEPAPE